MLDFCGRKQILPVFETIAMSEITEAFARLERGACGIAS
ncbi:MAG: hypothetical protein JWQ90_778 [Hydrocarboniphaga sp.]|nr:hypothetical protein [Hydrocarboniphaga sp.]